MRVLVTGSSGLIGSEAVAFFDELGFPVTGIDNNMRADFFGPQGDTTENRHRLQSRCPKFKHVELDIRDRQKVDQLFETVDLSSLSTPPPSPATIWLPAAVRRLRRQRRRHAEPPGSRRRHAPEAVFIHMSTNKVYGDGPNRLPLRELETRWDYARCDRLARHRARIFRIDQTLHSLFGASKVAGDVMVQEYGRYFGMKTGIFRGGCLTGPPALPASSCTVFLITSS